MKHLSVYENFKTEQEISYICEKYDIKNWSINSDGLVDVDGDVYLNYNALDKLPLNFGRVTGHFLCNNNKLTSLEDSPEYVGGHFYCSVNNLISLKGGPKYVGGDFQCGRNKLVNLEGAPRYASHNFDCSSNKLVNFEGAPDFVGGSFDCGYNLIYIVWELFEDYSKIELFNYYDIVRYLDGKPAIVLARLNQFLEDIGKTPVEKVDGYINI